MYIKYFYKKMLRFLAILRIVKRKQRDINIVRI
jgi:hypothetical protein